MKYLIWSNQHHAWWCANESGYTNLIEVAGRYSEEQAKKIVNEATLNGQLITPRYNWKTDSHIDTLDEVMVLAPEELSEALNDSFLR